MEKELWKGNEAIAEAAIRAGCDCFFGYPITPQSEVPEYMSAHLPKAGGVFLQSHSLLKGILSVKRRTCSRKMWSAIFNWKR